jgi:hypothetical protein
MLFESRTIAKSFATCVLFVAALLLAIDLCDAGRRGGGGGGRGGGFGGGAHINNGFNHRPSGGGSYHRPGGGYDGAVHIDNSLPGRPGNGRPDRPGDGRPDRPGDGGGNDKPSGGHDNDYYFGWDHPTYGYTGLAVGTYVHTVPTNCVYEEHGGLTYRRCGDVWYQPTYEDAGVRYVVVNRPY